MTKKTLNLTRGLEVKGKYSNIDFLYGPYATSQAACKRVVEAVRLKGLTVGIIERGSIVEYWWRDGIKDSDLILKNPSKEKVEELEGRVDNLEQGFDLTFTLEEKEKLAGIEEGANNTNDEDVESWGFTKNKGTVTKVRINGLNINPSNDGLVDLGRVELIQADPKLPNDYVISNLSNEDLSLLPNDNYNTAFSKLEKNIIDNELVTAAALNDLNNRINESDTTTNLEINNIKTDLLNISDKSSSTVNIQGHETPLNFYRQENFLKNSTNKDRILNFEGVSNLVKSYLDSVISRIPDTNDDITLDNINLIHNSKATRQITSLYALSTFGESVSRTIEESQIVTAAALNDLNDRLNNINISISDSYESPLSEGGITPNDSYEEAFRKLEDNILNISKFIGEDIEIIPTLDNSIYYTGSDVELNNFSNYNTFTNSNKSIIKNVYLGNIYYYLLIPLSYTIKIITENNEDITEMFISKANMTISNISYRVLEFHLSSNLPLDTNVTINITT